MTDSGVGSGAHARYARGAGPVFSGLAWKVSMKHNLTLVILTAEQIARAKEANGRRKRITHALVCGPYGQMFGTEKECLKYFRVWDPDHRIEAAPGEFRAPFGSLFDKAVKTTAHAITDYRTTPGLGTRLMAASGTTLGEAPSARGLFGRIFAGN